MSHQPGTVIVPCQEQARYHGFTFALRGLELPPGSGLIFGVGTSIVQNMNDALTQVPDSAEWVWLIGDDHTFSRDTVLRLLDRNEDVIAPLCVRRGAPFPLVHYPEGLPSDDPDELYQGMGYDEIPEEPFEVAATGSAMLIRRHVWEVLEPPVFRNTADVRLTEDLNLCARIRAAGFRVMVDPDVQLGHYDIVNAQPAYRDGAWGLLLSWQNGYEMFQPHGLALTEREMPVLA